MSIDSIIMIAFIGVVFGAMMASAIFTSIVEKNEKLRSRLESSSDSDVREMMQFLALPKENKPASGVRRQGASKKVYSYSEYTQRRRRA